MELHGSRQRTREGPTLDIPPLITCIVRRIRAEEIGQLIVEYSIVMGIVSAITFVFIGVLEAHLSELYAEINQGLDTALVAYAS
jgi:hypothetical protein